MAYNFTIPGLGCTLSYSTSLGGSYTAVTQLKSIDGTSSELSLFDSTGIGSTAGEQIPTLFRAGDFGFKVIYDPANTTHAAIHAAHKAGTLLYWKLTFANPVGPGASAPGSAIVCAFAAYAKTFAISGFEAESGLEASVVLGTTGSMTIA